MRSTITLSLLVLSFAACGDAQRTVNPWDISIPDAGTGDMASAFDSGEKPPKREPTAPYYELDRVLEVDITLAPDDWDALRSQTRSFFDILTGDCLDQPFASPFSYFAADVVVDGVRVENIGLRKKGFIGSLSTSKPSLKVKFDKYVDGQLLEGALERMTLNNVQQDQSKINTCLTYHVFNAAGVPAPRCNFATVTVNGEDLGLFVHLESVKKPFLREHYDDDDGNLYEGTLSDFLDAWDGTLEKKTNETENDFSDVEAVVAAMTLPDSQYLAALEEAIDLEQYLTFWATESIVAHWDGYNGNRNNFFIYKEADRPFVFMPWGADATFRNLSDRGQGPQPESVFARSFIAHRLYSDPAVQPRYVQRVQQVLDTAWDENELEGLAMQMSEIVQTHALDSSAQRAASDTPRIFDFIRGRRATIEAERSTPVPLPGQFDSSTFCWREIGELDLSFTTRWGSRGAPAPLDEGTVDVTTFSIGGTPRNFTDSGVTSGFADPEPGEPPSMEIAIFMISADGIIDLLVLNIPQSEFQSGETLLFELGQGSSYIVQVFPPTYQDFQALGHVPRGVLELELAETTPGGTIRGSIRGTIHNFGD